MKRIFTIALALVVLALTASAQVGPNAITLGTNAVPVATTNSTVSSSVDILNQKTVSLFVSGKSASTTNLTTVTLQIKVSPDDTTYYMPDIRYRIPLVLNGTTTATTYTNLDTAGFRFFQIAAIENIAASGATNTVTNLTVYYYYK